MGCASLSDRYPDAMRKKERYAVQYPVLAHRVANWHQLLWQVPLFAFTAQAFTFTIALDPEASRAARLIACAISAIISVVSLVTLVRQRKADLLDSGQLAMIEQHRDWPEDERLHGPIWADRRTSQEFDWKWLDRMLGKWNLTLTWAVAFFFLLAAAGLVAGLEVFWPEFLDGEALGR